MLGSGDMRRPPLYLCPPPKAYDCQHIFHKLWIAINNLLKHYPQCAEKWDPREFYLWGYLWLLPYDAKEGSEAGHLALLSCNWGLDSHVYRTWPLRVLAWSLQAGERTCLYLIVSIFTIAPSFSLFSQWKRESYTDFGWYIRCVLTITSTLVITAEAQLGKQEQNNYAGGAQEKTVTSKTRVTSSQCISPLPKGMRGIWMAASASWFAQRCSLALNCLTSHSCHPFCHSGPTFPLQFNGWFYFSAFPTSSNPLREVDFLCSSFSPTGLIHRAWKRGIAKKKKRIHASVSFCVQNPVTPPHFVSIKILCYGKNMSWGTNPWANSRLGAPASQHTVPPEIAVLYLIPLAFVLPGFCPYFQVSRE